MTADPIDEGPRALVYIEAQRKFLVADPSVLAGLSGTRIAQGYLLSSPNRSVRVRLSDSRLAVLTVKGPRVKTMQRTYDYPIPPEMAEVLLAFCEPAVVTKLRYSIIMNDLEWRVDVFEDANEGLLLAEVHSLDGPDVAKIPSFCGREVTNDPRYQNEYLAMNPYEGWPGR